MGDGSNSLNRESNAQGDEYYDRYRPLYGMIEKNDWQGVEDFVKQTKEAQSSKDAQQDLYRKLCRMIERNDWQGAEDFVRGRKEARSSKDARGDEYYGRYLLLDRMIKKNDWQGVDDFVTNHRDALTAEFERSETIFHLILGLLLDAESDKAAGLIDKLASMVVSDTDTLAHTLARQNVHGETVLTLCAIKGNLKASKVLLKYKPNLPTIKDNGGELPVHKAALYGHKDAFQYLLEETRGVDIYSGDDGASLLICLFDANFYDVALDLLKRHPKIGRHSIESRRRVLNILAQRPNAFESGSRLGRLQRLIYNCIPLKTELVSSIQTDADQNVAGDMENLNVTSQSHSKKSTSFGSTQQITTTFGAMCHKLFMMFWNALIHLGEIVRIMCEEVVWTNRANIDRLSWAMFTAARLGIRELVTEFIMATDTSARVLNEYGRTIFDLAVLYRREKVFNLIQHVNYSAALFTTRDRSENNILHLAGGLVPSSEVAGAALQMQRELQWFKTVENLVHPALRGAENKLKQTPREVFTKEHKELVKEGEKWTKETASSCSVVAALIVTVVFAAAFTVPGGSDSRGTPNFVHEPSFMIFAISDMLALFSSIASVLMFLGILTSRYAEEDFLVSLPRKLIIGLITLFFSIASMMVAFGATIHIALYYKWNLVFVPIALVGFVPVTLFALLQFPLLLDMYSSTYGRGIFIHTSWRELNSRQRVIKAD